MEHFVARLKQIDRYSTLAMIDAANAVYDRAGVWNNQFMRGLWVGAILTAATFGILKNVTEFFV